MRTAVTIALPPTADDKALISFFDDPTRRQFVTGSPTGIFGHPTLTSPAALEKIAEATLVRAQRLTERITSAPQSRSEMFKVVKNLDRLSDLICSVVDLAEFVRNAHPERAWVDSANNLYEGLSEFMNVLNTHVGLYDVCTFVIHESILLNISHRQILKIVFADPELVKSLSKEAHETALIFWRDFETCAINLPIEQRNRFVSLSTDILVLGRQFLDQGAHARPPATISSEELAGLKDRGMGVRLKLQARVTKRDLQVYPGSLQAQMIMRSAPSEEPRRKVYVAANSSTQEEIDVLENLLKRRGELANLVGTKSYAHLALVGKMAKTPGIQPLILSKIIH